MLKLLGQRRFLPLFVTQALSAFNDNLLKTALVLIILFHPGGARSETMVTLAGAVFILPFFLLSGLGGEMADRFDKALVARRLKLFEIAAAMIAVAGFYMVSVPVLFVALLLFGVNAALFGPIKYGILPDHLPEQDLPAANALIEAATFLAILAGTILAGMVSRSGMETVAGLVLAVQVACYLASTAIPPTGAAAPGLAVRANILASTGDLIRDLRADRQLWWAGLVVSVFWMVGAIAMALLPPLVKTVLGGTEVVVSLAFALFAIGIAVGSAAASWLMGGRILLLPVPFAAMAMGLAAAGLMLAAGAGGGAGGGGMAAVVADPQSWRIAASLVGLAMAGGVFIVPSFAAAQNWAPKERRARVVAAINVLNAAFMVAGTLVVGALQAQGLSVAGAFGLIAVFCLIAALLIWWTFPGNLPVEWAALRARFMPRD